MKVEEEDDTMMVMGRSCLQTPFMLERDNIYASTSTGSKEVLFVHQLTRAVLVTLLLEFTASFSVVCAS